MCISRESGPFSGRRQRVIAWLSGQSTLEQIYRSPQSFHPRENDVFMLDGQPTVITVNTKTVTEPTPPLLSVSDSQGDVTPGAVLDILMPDGFQAASQIQRSIVETGVFCVHMKDRIAKGLDCRQGIGAHPKQVTRIKICTNCRPGCPPQLKKCRDVVHQLVSVHLDTKFLNAVLVPKSGKLLPVRQQFFVPLPIQNFSGLRRPSAGDPIWCQVLGPAARQTGH